MATPFDGLSGNAGTSLELLESEALPEVTRAPEAPRVTLEDVLAAPPRKAGATPLVAGAAMRTARLASVSGQRASILVRGALGPVEAAIAPEVDPEVIADAHARGDAVLVELSDGEQPLIVAALTTRRPREIRLKAAKVVIEGGEELLLRSGRGAIRIREDGDIEVVGSRISAASRGLFRIVGRLLRLN